MTMHFSQPWKSYRQVATQTAPPGQLILMLFEGALRSLERARQGFEAPDPAEANMTIHNNVFRAQEIVRELDQALDMEQGVRNIEVYIKGPGSGREAALRSLQAAGFKVDLIRDVTPIPHNGCRPPKRRRV